jgi:TPR repeat protein
MYSALRWFGQPTFYDKLLCVPVLNLMVPALDRFSDRVAARVRLLNTDWAFNPQRYNFAHMAAWTALFAGMLFSGFLSKGAEHPGGNLAFWQQTCEQGRWNACKTYAQALAVTCRFRPGDVCVTAGAMLNRGENLKRDPVLSAISFSRACQVGIDEGCAGMVALLRRDGEAALQKACDGGDGTSCLTLASASTVGLGVPVDSGRALKLFRQACDRGYLMGCRQAAQRYLYGRGAAADPAMAVESFEKACRGKDPTSCAEVADLYRRGVGGRKDETLAAQRFQQACNLGLQSACQPEAIAEPSIPASNP